MATKKNKQIQQALIKFYHNPVAKVSFELFLTIFGVIFFAIFAIRPTLLTMSDLIKEIEDKEKLDKQLQRKVAALSTAQQEYQLYGDQLQLVDEAIPDRMQLIKTLKIIEKIASEQDLIISDLRLASIPNEGRKTLTSENIARIDQGLELSVMGSYPSIRDFVESLQQSRRTLVANVVEFNIKEDRSQTTLEATMTISIPYFKTQNE